MVLVQGALALLPHVARRGPMRSADTLRALFVYKPDSRTSVQGEEAGERSLPGGAVLRMRA